MKYILIFWGLPMGLFWGWYYLSYNDMHFGYLMLSRLLHDHVFEIYGQILGVDPASIMPLVTRACIVDTVLIFAIYVAWNTEGAVEGIVSILKTYGPLAVAGFSSVADYSWERVRARWEPRGG